ncbi:MAG: GAF domain-containing protein [Anaerolineaceae bacterium]|nr:GAF domain-containing protein [Anaerolineaceae bacterium]
MSVGLGIGLLIAGLAILLAVWAVLRVLPRVHSTVEVETARFSFSDPSKSKDAVIILQPGGRVDYISRPARTYFDLRENESYDIERLARRVRPADEFLDLCAVSGSKRLTIGGKLVEVTSIEVPGAFPMMLVSLRSREFSTLEPGGGASEEILRVVTEFNRTIAASLDLEATMHSVLGFISRLVPSDLLEIKLWNADDQTLDPYRYQEADASTPAGTTRTKSSVFGSFSDRLISKRIPIFFSDARAQPELIASGELASIQSYLGIPLFAGDEFVGVLEAGQTIGSAFGSHDLELLQLIAGQAAVSIRNAKLYEGEQKRAAELAGLANLNQSLGSIRDTQDLFARLVASIAPLFSCDIVGFLLYDDEKRIIEGRIPFRGLPSHFVEILTFTRIS